MSRRLGREKCSRGLGVALTPPEEDARGRLAETERAGERVDLGAGARRKPPRALVHENEG